MKSNRSVFGLNIDGLVGPTHHYAGLSEGNIASTSNAYMTANPAAAARQGIEKMRFLHRLGIKQAVLPPHARPNLALLNQLGFSGTPIQQLTAAHTVSPKLLTACFSASSMWAANSATASPSTDTQDERLHFTAANLVTQLHRHQEADFSHQILQKIFANPAHFKHHPPLPKTQTLSDEGAANHNRLCEHHAKKGTNLFIYGRVGLETNPTQPARFPARQTLEASQAIARLHQLQNNRVIFARQNPLAIDAGVFHHDVIGVANESLLLIHEDALVNQAEVLKQLQQTLDFPLQLIEISRQTFTLQDAVESYIFNSQIITLPTEQKSMLLVAPTECETHPRIKPWIDELISDSTNPIHQVNYFDLKQSMQNGGGPACLRLRVPMNHAELNAMHPHVLINDTLLDALDAWVGRHYRTELHPRDLLDPALTLETHLALDELTKILHLGNIYSFQ